ncbi:Cerebroside-sulfatase, partial [Verrucomicrobiota bacterium]
VCELYDLAADVSETTDVADEHPVVVRELTARVEACRRDMGDEITGVTGENVRPAGRVEHPKPLTDFDPEHPYFIAMYDMKDAG